MRPLMDNMGAGVRTVRVSQTFTFTRTGDWPEQIKPHGYETNQLMRPESVEVMIDRRDSEKPHAEAYIAGHRIVRGGLGMYLRRRYFATLGDAQELPFVAECVEAALAAFE